MSGSIFLLQGGADLVRLNEAPYDSESLLQQLLAQYPDLLAGDQIDHDEPRRWLLISREMAVPGELDGAGRWWLDHLFLDQEGIPTLVEVKRSSDTRIRREVVGQMLDYAANAVVYWPLEVILTQFVKTCEAQESDPDEEVTNLIRAEGSVEEFWKQVKTNLEAGRIRLVFVADEIPPELRRIVEFLNGQMDPAEVLAVEIKQYVGEQVKTLVPRVFGQTESARGRKQVSSSARETIDDGAYLGDFDAGKPEPDQAVARKIIAWSRGMGLRDSFRRGQKGASFIPILQRGNESLYPFSLQSRGKLVIQMRWLRDHAPFDEAAKREELLNRLTSIPGLQVTKPSIDGFPKIPVGCLTTSSVLDALLATMTWLVQQIGSKSLGDPSSASASTT